MGAARPGDLGRRTATEEQSAGIHSCVSTERDAELEGLKLARKWIDDGKPELGVGPT